VRGIGQISTLLRNISNASFYLRFFASIGSYALHNLHNSHFRTFVLLMPANITKSQNLVKHYLQINSGSNSCLVHRFSIWYAIFDVHPMRMYINHGIPNTTRNSAIADKPRDAFRGQSRSPNMYHSIC